MKSAGATLITNNEESALHSPSEANEGKKTEIIWHWLSGALEEREVLRVSCDADRQRDMLEKGGQRRRV